MICIFPFCFCMNRTEKQLTTFLAGGSHQRDDPRDSHTLQEQIFFPSPDWNDCHADYHNENKQHGEEERETAKTHKSCEMPASWTTDPVWGFPQSLQHRTEFKAAAELQMNLRLSKLPLVVLQAKLIADDSLIGSHVRRPVLQASHCPHRHWDSW